MVGEVYRSSDRTEICPFELGDSLLVWLGGMGFPLLCIRLFLFNPKQSNFKIKIFFKKKKGRKERIHFLSFCYMQTKCRCFEVDYDVVFYVGD